MASCSASTTTSEVDLDKNEDMAGTSSSAGSESAVSPEADMDDSGSGADSLSCETSQLPRRLSRNRSEKMRRDKLNMYLQELAREVPIISASQKKVDKSSVLRLTVTYLKLYFGLHGKKQLQDCWSKQGFSAESLGKVLQKALNGFLLIVSQAGCVIFVSDAVSDLLGHNQFDLIGKPFDTVVHPSDWGLFSSQFAPEDVSQSKKTYRSFYIRLLSTMGKESGSYALVHFVGHLQDVSFSSPGSGKKSEQWLVATGMVMSQAVIQDMSATNRDDEWITQHAMDGKILFSDPRSACITGRLFVETDGKSVYQFIHPGDLEAVGRSHKKIMMMDSIPSTIFRLQLAGGRKTVYIQSRSCIARDRWTGKSKFIMSLNIVLSDQDGQELLDIQNKMIEQEKQMDADGKAATLPLTPGEGSLCDSPPMPASKGEVMCSGQETSYPYQTVATSCEGDILNIKNLLVLDPHPGASPGPRSERLQEAPGSRAGKHSLSLDLEDLEWCPRSKAPCVVPSTLTASSSDNERHDSGSVDREGDADKRDSSKPLSSPLSGRVTPVELSTSAAAVSASDSPVHPSPAHSVSCASKSPATHGCSVSSCAPLASSASSSASAPSSASAQSSAKFTFRSSPSSLESTSPRSEASRDARPILSGLLSSKEASVGGGSKTADDAKRLPSFSFSTPSSLHLRQRLREDLLKGRDPCSGKDRAPASPGAMTVMEEFQYFSNQVQHKHRSISESLVLQEKLLSEIDSQLVCFKHLTASPEYRKLQQRLLLVKEAKRNQLKELELLKQVLHSQSEKMSSPANRVAVVSPMQRGETASKPAIAAAPEQESGTCSIPSRCLSASADVSSASLQSPCSWMSETRSSPGRSPCSVKELSPAARPSSVSVPCSPHSAYSPSVSCPGSAVPPVPHGLPQPLEQKSPRHCGGGVSPRGQSPGRFGAASPMQRPARAARQMSFQHGLSPSHSGNPSTHFPFSPSQSSSVPPSFFQSSAPQNSFNPAFQQGSSGGFPQPMSQAPSQHPFQHMSSSSSSYQQGVPAGSTSHSFGVSSCSLPNYHKPSGNVAVGMAGPYMSCDDFGTDAEEQGFFPDQTWQGPPQHSSLRQPEAMSGYGGHHSMRNMKPPPPYGFPGSGVRPDYNSTSQLGRTHGFRMKPSKTVGPEDFDVMNFSAHSGSSSLSMSQQQQQQQQDWSLFEMSSLLAKASQTSGASLPSTQQSLHGVPHTS